MRKKFFCSIFSLLLTVQAFSLDFAFRIAPALLFPTQDGLALGFGGSANLDVDLFNFLTAGVELAYSTVEQEALGKNYNMIMGGACIGAYYYPLSRLYLSANGSFGLNTMQIDAPSFEDGSSSTRGMYWRTFGEVGFRFTPDFVLSGVGGYKNFIIDGENYISAPFAGLSAKINFSTGKKSSTNFAVTFEQDASAYPVFANMYKTTPLGYATIKNMSGAEARDVHVSFRAGKYTAAAKECASISMLNRYESAEIPVYAEFSPELLRFSEDGKINGELVISYNFLGKKVTEVQNIVLDVLHRNSFSWNDNAALACFVDSNTPEILEAAKYIAGAEIINLKPGLNTPLQYAAAIMDGLRLAGIAYSEDTLSPYVEFRTSDKTDSIQYPLQTLALLGGDYDDIGILVCSCLESFAIGTGFAALDDDFIVLVDTGIMPEKSVNQFDASDVVTDANTTWLALSMKEFANGFTQSRSAGAKKLNDIFKNQDSVSEDPIIVDIHAAWEFYKPATFTGYTGSYKNPSKEAIVKRVNEDVRYYIDHDLAALIKKFKAAGNTKLLADSYVRAGMYDQAIAEYQKLNTLSSLNNMGMVYMAQRNYKAARGMYEKVLARDSSNKTALAGLKKIKALSGE